MSPQTQEIEIESTVIDPETLRILVDLLIVSTNLTKGAS